MLVMPKIAEKITKIAMLTVGEGSVPLNENSLTRLESKSTNVAKIIIKTNDVFLVRFKLGNLVLFGFIF
jgi:hypothetical protein